MPSLRVIGLGVDVVPRFVARWAAWRGRVGLHVTAPYVDKGAHERLLREAHRLFTKMGATVRAEQVIRELV